MVYVHENCDYIHELRDRRSSWIIFFPTCSEEILEMGIDFWVPEVKSTQIFSCLPFSTSTLWKNQEFIVIACLGPPKYKFRIFPVEISESGRHL